MSFIDDIQGKNTQLFPIVKIGTDYYSTNNFSLKLEESLPDWMGGGTITSIKYCKPLLMNIPSIKESIDIESRKFKISNVNLQFNNFLFDGVRFSDQLSETSLINTEAIIYFKSQSEGYDGLREVYQGVIRRISHDDAKVKISLEDLTEQKAHKNLPQANLGSGEGIPDKYKNKPIPMVYGEVKKSPLVVNSNYRRFLADSRTIEGIIEADSGFSTYDGSPQDYFDSTIGDIALTEDGNIMYGGLFLDGGDKYINVIRSGQYSSGQSISLLSNNQDIFPIDEATEPFLRCLDSNSDFNFTIKNRLHPTPNNDLQGEDYLFSGSLDAITDGSNSDNQVIINSDALGDSVMSEYELAIYPPKIEILLLEFMINYEPTYDYEGHVFPLGFQINGYNIPKVLESQNPSSGQYTEDGTTAGIPSHGSPPMFGGEPDGIGHGTDGISDNYNMLNPFATQPFGDALNTLFAFVVSGTTYGDSNAPIKLKFSWEVNSFSVTNSMGVVLFYDNPAVKSFIIQFRSVVSLDGDSGDSTPHFELDGNLKEISLIRKVNVTKIFQKDFYAHVKGRINTFADHPSLDATLGDDPATEDIVETDYLVSGDFIENPIDIIYDLVRNEIGHDAIDEAEYAEAKAAHLDWKFGFTINKKINSKKLIEDIAKSTKCFPKFKNDGTFGFNTIKNNYTVSNIGDDGIERGDYNTATLIKESEVISYSFKKTKPEQIYKKVDVQYHKDYALDSHTHRTPSIYTGINTGEVDEDGELIWTADYYGIGNSKDNHLEVESDYIRHDFNSSWEQTSFFLAEFLSEQYRNDHLIFNLKLPLQYINLEIGDLIKFRELFGGVKAYGIDYRIIQSPNLEDDPQVYFPLFIITSTTKNLDSVSIECMQLHYLQTTILEYGGVSSAWSEDDIGETFYFPDAAPIIIPDIDVTEVVIVPPMITIPDIDTEYEIANNTVIISDPSVASIDVYVPYAVAVDGYQDYADISDLIIVEALGQTFSNDSPFLDNFGEDTQFDVLYSVTSPVTGFAANPVLITVDVNVSDPPSLDIFSTGASPYQFIAAPASYEFIHTILLEGNEGVDYFEKYVYNTSDFQEVGYYAFDNEDVIITNNTFFFPEDLVDINNPVGVPFSLDIVAEEFSEQAYGNVLHWDFNVVARVIDSSGLWDTKKWVVRILNPYYEPSALLGDVNDDFEVNVLDVVQIVNYILQPDILPLDEQSLINANVNQDDVVNVLDVVTIVNMILES